MKRDNYKDKLKMGMAATQGRLLSLVNRNSSIGYEKSKISIELLSLSREMSNVTKQYNNALSQKSLKLTNDGGVNYIDMSYANMMRPINTLTSKNESPYIITNRQGKVIVDNKYKKYAEMISPEGEPGGDWESVRNQILAELCGINEGDLDEFLQLEEATYNTQAHYEELESYLGPDNENVIAAYNVFIDAQAAWNSHFLYSEEAQIHFYDDLFSTIAELGWEYDDEAGDSERLNQLFQNGTYAITKVDRSYKMDGYFNVYETDIASNLKEAVLINDKEKNQRALTKYENLKAKINEKETRKNTRMEQLNIEQQSIESMMESLKKVISENSERNFSLNG